MLGIIFTGGEGPKPEAIRLLLGKLRARSILVAADSGLELAEAAGLKPDWITGDMDSLDSEERLRLYPAERVIRHATGKDHTDTELAFALLQEKGCDEIWIIGGGGGRLDHLFAIRDLFERDFFPVRWITAAEDIYCIDAKAGGNALSVNLKPGTSVSVFLAGAGTWKAKSEGLKWPLENVCWERGLFGLSNVAVNGNFSINAEEGRFMVILPLSAIVY